MPDLPEDRRRRRWLGRPFLLAGTVLLAVAAGAGVALAATSAPSTSGSAGPVSAAASSPAPQTPRPDCLRVIAPNRGGRFCHRPGLGGALHGTLVLPKPGGGTVTAEIQNGKVTAISRSSITLKSTDGFTKTYAVTGSTIVGAQRDGIGSVKVGDQVWMTATARGGAVTANRVMDLSQLMTGLGILPGLPALPVPRSLPAHWPGGSAASFTGGVAGG
jgi:hypothetical protein